MQVPAGQRVAVRVLSLCDRTGVMVQPWLEAGHHCTIVDLQHAPGQHTEGNLTRIGADLWHWRPTFRFDVGFAFPDCTHLAGSGARWWASKGPTPFLWALDFVHTCRRIIERARRFWLLENPRGRLSTWWRKPDHEFNPCDYGGYLDPPGDAYTKLTCLWTSTSFAMPPPKRVDPIEGSKMHFVSPSPERKNIRSVTPEGFARAVFAANCKQTRKAA